MSAQTLFSSVAEAADALLAGRRAVADVLDLPLSGCRIRVCANDRALLERLADYFGYRLGATGDADLLVELAQREAPELGLAFHDWAREPGKSGRKDSYLDIPQGRLVRKVRTGMVFLQSESRRIAACPCLEYLSQVVNFINSQYMNWLQQRGWLICHASGMVLDERALAIAGFSGGGKSTLMLQLMEDERIDYLTNDRLFVGGAGDTLMAEGIPKWPRINPGTIVHNPRLAPLIDEPRRARLLAMPADQLWQLEEKYDAPIGALYGAGRVSGAAPMAGFVVLNWQRDETAAAAMNRVDLSQRRELLQAIMKSPGPFYQYPDGSFFRDDQALDEQAYLRMLRDVPVWEVSGGVDFQRVAGMIRENWPTARVRWTASDA